MSIANSQFKLADVLFAYELSSRLKGTGVTVNCLHPGAVSTDSVLRNESVPSYQKVIYLLLRSFFISPEKAAEKVVYLASCGKLKGVAGKYLANNLPVKSSPASYDKELQKKLWMLSLKLTNLKG